LRWDFLRESGQSRKIGKIERLLDRIGIAQEDLQAGGKGKVGIF